VSGLTLLGWVGSALLIFSLLQARVLRFRVLNLTAGLILIVFNALIQVWPMAAMNAVLSVINVWFIVKLLREKNDDQAYAVLEVRRDDIYLDHFVDSHRAEIDRLFPTFAALDPDVKRSAFLVQHGDETAGVVVVDDGGDGTAHVVLDYVTARFRDFTPGEFVFRRSGLFAAHGWHRVVTPAGMVNPYYGKLGFTRSGESWVLDLA
jgi:hypothetical protein